MVVGNPENSFKIQKSLTKSEEFVTHKETPVFIKQYI